MSWTDVRIIGDLLLVRLLWLALSELVLKPMLLRKYAWLDRLLGGRLPDIP